MRNRGATFLCFFLGLTGLSAECQTTDPCHYSTEGKDFWFGIMGNRKNGPEHYLEITVTSRKGADFSLTYGPQETLIGKFSVDPNSSVPVRLDTLLLEPNSSERTEDRGIHLVATDSVNVYALNYKTKSSDVAVIYPSESLGKEYFVMCYTPNPTRNIESNSEFYIVATENETHIDITPSVDTDRGRKALVTFPIILNKGQSYQVQSMNSTISGQGDLTGSCIQSDKRIAVYSGNKSTAVPLNGGTRDYLYEQIPSTSTWGRDFYVVPLRFRTRDTYRILAAEDETVITIEGLGKTVTLNRGTFYEFNLTSNQASRIFASKKVLLAQFCRSQEADENRAVGDPFMIILSPISQKVNDVTFEAYETDLVRNIFYVNVITAAADVANITLDGTGIASLFRNYPNGKYAFAQVPVTAGTHRLFCSNKKSGFLAYVYGFGDNNNTESYGYGVGFNLDIQLEIGGSFDPVNDTLLICEGDVVRLEAGEYFVGYRWNTGEITQSILISGEGMYRVTATTAERCQKTDSLYVKVDRPRISLGNDTAVCLPGQLTLVAPEGYSRLEWQNGSSAKAFVVKESGLYSLKATNKNGCTTSDSIQIQILMPEISFSTDFDSITTDHPIINFKNETSGNLVCLWNFGDGQTSTETNPSHRYPAEPKTYQVTLKATDMNGCSDSVSSEITVVPSTFLVPNAFRPTSDIEENRVFKPSPSAVDRKHYSLRIFSRTGAMVYESNQPDRGWDGANAEQGMYVWILKYRDIQQYEHLQKGTVMLLK